MRRKAPIVHNPSSMKEIVFVCTGNTCRSPIAEGLLLATIPSYWRSGIAVSSAGTSAWDGQPASESAVEALGEIGIDISRHRARMLTREIIEAAALVVALARCHRDTILELAPEAAGRVLVIGELEPGRDDPDVPDPIGGEIDLYRQVRDDVERLVGLLLPHIARRFELSRTADG